MEKPEPIQTHSETPWYDITNIGKIAVSILASTTGYLLASRLFNESLINESGEHGISLKRNWKSLTVAILTSLGINGLFAALAKSNYEKGHLDGIDDGIRATGELVTQMSHGKNAVVSITRDGNEIFNADATRLREAAHDGKVQPVATQQVSA